MADSTIITEQFVRIRQTPASVGDRILAVLIDVILLSLYSVGIYTLFALIEDLWRQNSIFMLTSAVLVVIPVLCYPLLCETLNRGQSLGKHLLNMRVVKLDGSTPSIGAYLTRWLLLLVDGPTFSFLGVIFMLFTDNNQRLGDLAAGTVVIKEKDYRKIPVSLDEFDYLTRNYHPVYPQSADLSLEQIHVISRTLALRGKERTHQSARLAKKVQETLSVKAKEPTPEVFLERIWRDYRYFALQEI